MAEASTRNLIWVLSLREPGSPVTAEPLRCEGECVRHLAGAGSASQQRGWRADTTSRYVSGRWSNESMASSTSDVPAMARSLRSPVTTTRQLHRSTKNLPTPNGRGGPLSKRRGLSQPAPASDRIALLVWPGPAATARWPLLSDATATRPTPEQTRLSSGRHGTSRARTRTNGFGGCMTHHGSTLSDMLCCRAVVAITTGPAPVLLPQCPPRGSRGAARA
jgi:hypothetical protein